MKHLLEIRIARSFTLEEVEILKDHLFECIISANEVCPGLEEVDITAKQIDLIVLDEDE